MMAQPPAFSTLAATASESVATTTSPTAAARARRKTCTIIGSPAISASGFSRGRRGGPRGGGRVAGEPRGAQPGRYDDQNVAACHWSLAKSEGASTQG